MRGTRVGLAVLLLVFAGLGVATYVLAERLDDALRRGDVVSVETPDRIGRYPRARFYLERDRFLPAIDPRTVPAGRAAFLRPSTEVFGVVVGGRARAYPVPMIAYHHVVNDVIAGIPIAVTY